MAQDQLEYIYCTREQRKTQTWSLYYSPKALGTHFYRFQKFAQFSEESEIRLGNARDGHNGSEIFMVVSQHYEQQKNLKF